MSIKKVPIVAIVGRANVGKSSLFNAILSRREAIVAREAGTTRDSLWEKAHFQDHDFWLIDTAGIKDAEDDFEFTIQEQVAQAADSSDVIWVVIEADTTLSEEDRHGARAEGKRPAYVVVPSLAPRLYEGARRRRLRHHSHGRVDLAQEERERPASGRGRPRPQRVPVVLGDGGVPALV
jgi:small GTP-binding protein